MTCETHKDLEDIIAKQNDKIFALEKDKSLLKEELNFQNYNKLFSSHIKKFNIKNINFFIWFKIVIS